ncbi:MAG TPA: type II toxin-antitoxin system prevent-host-death family antitoxin [Rhodoglobus sp.]|nr:type II toxin-antitoxin system prevent-host-death family antitoxin [Rhodoglobus sp.]
MYTQPSHEARQLGEDRMEPVNILDARNRFSQLITAAINGEDVVIAKRGRPVVRIVPIVDDAANTGADLVQWLEEHPLPAGAVRSAEELDEQIAREREAWD